VDPHQLLGLAVNPRAAAIAELVLWIATSSGTSAPRGRVAPPEPIIKNFHNIKCRDAVLASDRTEPVLDAQEGSPTRGQPVIRWDGRTMKMHPVTGDDVPDETARVPLLSYVNPRRAEWPQADFTVGNPPFIGTARMREALGDGYTEAVRATYPDVPESADFVMYWWEKAASLVRAGAVRQFGFITTNSLRQTFNRRVVEWHLSGSPSSPESSRAPAGAHPSHGAEPVVSPPANFRQPSGLAAPSRPERSAPPPRHAAARQGWLRLQDRSGAHPQPPRRQARRICRNRTPS